MTRVEQAIIRKVKEAGGRWQDGLWRLADQLDISYSNAHLRVQILELIGAIEVERRTGQPLILKISTNIPSSSLVSDVADISSSSVSPFASNQNPESTIRSEL